MNHLRTVGLKRLNRALDKERSVVRFYVRDSKGRFTSTKVSYMPHYLMRDSLCHKWKWMEGEMLYLNHRGFIVPIKQKFPICFNQINWQSFKRAK